MERNELSKEIVDFFTQYGFFYVSEKSKNTRVNAIVQQLDESWFLEHLIQTLMLEAKYKENMDYKRLNQLISELEKIRLELE